ncbi:MAG: LamG domain-containing protein, partial [Planctomycetes bacterium]|nr:LamG domain-containing protein [Planctomycetota bacterium]
EMPGVDATGPVPVFTRTFDVGPRESDLVLQVAHADQNAILWTAAPDSGAAQASAHPAADNGASGGPNLTASSQAVVLFGQPAVSRIEDTAAALRFDGATRLEVDQAKDFDLADRDYTVFARINTRHGGSIFCKTKPDGNWVRDGKSLFVRGGRLVFDIGWVGAVTSRRAIDDGQWHDVALTYRHDDGHVKLYIDGSMDAEGRLQPKQRVRGHVVRIGYTAPNFPGPRTFFEGQLDDVRFFRRRLDDSQIAQLPAVDLKEGLIAHWRPSPARGDRVADSTGLGHDARVLRGEAGSEPAAKLLAGVWPPVTQARWQVGAGRNLLLRLPKGEQTLRFTLSTAGVEDEEQVPVLTGQFAADNATLDLRSLTHGGPPRWADRLTVDGIQGDDEGPFAIDVLQHPDQNPWFCRMRLTGFDFFPDGRRAAVCSWDGDVWLVDGIDPQRPVKTAPDQLATFPLTWQRIASGLFQPLGLKIVDGQIFVTCRDQLVVLHDLNGDGETDFYQNFNNDHQVTEHFHEFAMGLQTDAEGNFYYAKSARHALPALVPHHGTLLRISRDGSRTDILAKGFRAANGVCVNPDGTFFVTDQEGHWMPKNRINWIDRPGKFYGNMWGYHDVTDPSDDAMEQPLCWITNAMDRSPAELLWVDSAAWGPLRGSLLNLSYGYGKIYIVPHERVGDRMQGGVCEFPLPPFPTGIMRGRFHPGNGQLYTCGMFAWAANPQEPGGFYRVRYTGSPVYLPVGLKARTKSLQLTFSGELDPKTACDVNNYAIKAWSIHRTERYGSDHYDEHALSVTAAALDEDRRTVRLEVPDLHTTWCMEIRYSIQSADGEYIEGKIHNTIHQLPP